MRNFFNDFKNLESNDKNIIVFIIGLILLILQKPIELISFYSSIILFILGLLCIIFSTIKSYLEDKKDGQWNNILFK